ncbi:hypothetical protein [Streptomyces sp. NPDC126514]
MTSSMTRTRPAGAVLALTEAERQELSRKVSEANKRSENRPK